MYLDVSQVPQVSNSWVYVVLDWYALPGDPWVFQLGPSWIRLKLEVATAAALHDRHPLWSPFRT